MNDRRPITWFVSQARQEDMHYSADRPPVDATNFPSVDAYLAAVFHWMTQGHARHDMVIALLDRAMLQDSLADDFGAVGGVSVNFLGLARAHRAAAEVLRRWAQEASE